MASILEHQVEILSLKHWIIGAVEINSGEDIVWTPSNKQWQLIWNKISSCEIPNAADNEIVTTFNEFKTWISGIADLLGDDDGNWTPTHMQWKKIFDKLNTIHEEIKDFEEPNIPSVQQMHTTSYNENDQRIMPPQTFIAPPTSSFIAPSAGKQNNGYTSPFGA